MYIVPLWKSSRLNLHLENNLYWCFAGNIILTLPPAAGGQAKSAAAGTGSAPAAAAAAVSGAAASKKGQPRLMPKPSLAGATATTAGRQLQIMKAPTLRGPSSRFMCMDIGFCVVLAGAFKKILLYVINDLKLM